MPVARSCPDSSSRPQIVIHWPFLAFGVDVLVRSFHSDRGGNLYQLSRLRNPKIQEEYRAFIQGKVRCCPFSSHRLTGRYATN